MKLLLTSSGISNEKVKAAFLGLIQGINKPRIAVLYTVKHPEDKKWLSNYHDQAAELKVDYDFINISEEKDLSDKNFYDCYYVAGGNTFYILDRLRKTKMLQVIQDSIDHGKLYIGLSAGSIIAGPDISIAGYGSGGGGGGGGIYLEGLTGLNFVPFNIYPHFSPQEEQFVQDYQRMSKNSVIALADGQALVVGGGDYKFIGGGLAFGMDISLNN